MNGIFSPKTEITDTGSGILRKNLPNSSESTGTESKSPVITDNNVTKESKSNEFAVNAVTIVENENKTAEQATENVESKEDKPENVEDNGEGSSNTHGLLKNDNISRANGDDLSYYYSVASETELKEQFPALDITKLKENKEFNSLLRTVMKNPTLSDIYACYNSIICNSEEKSRQMLAQALANADTCVGALSSTETGAMPFFTKEQVMKMSPEQIRQNFQQIRESQSKW